MSARIAASRIRPETIAAEDTVTEATRDDTQPLATAPGQTIAYVYPKEAEIANQQQQLALALVEEDQCE